ncbi:MAG TPA: L-lysine 6-transaminase [Acidimicrobiales bacterium]|nr:L-lysine 6-transaminase [Acidimicrobiales bacterium]
MSAPVRQRGREGGGGEAPAGAAPGTGAPIGPADAHAVLSRHLLVDGYPLVLDLAKSHGSWLVDARDGTEYLDFYTFFASSPLGLNPPGLADDASFLEHLAVVAANKPANSDIVTVELARFADTFARVLGDPELPHLFFIEGGALAVENALKVAFDWKSRRNEAAGRSRDLGTRVLHLRHAFHGRSGYTMSLTNTDPVKVDRFPKLDWPRISSPAVTFPIEEHMADVEAAERLALAEAEAAFARHPHDIACFIAEPIQAEGGDRHLRAEFLRAMQELCRANDALFVLDEVQTGVGVTGTAWCYQQLGLEPDVVAFGKKVQLGGVMAGRRVDEVEENVFRTPSRINSTWGGNLVDMVRSTRLLELIEATGAMANAAERGEQLLGHVRALAADHPGLITNPRGRGLLVACDLPSAALRDGVIRSLREEEHVIALGCGDASIRFRPALSVSAEEVDAGARALARVVSRAAKQVGR